MGLEYRFYIPKTYCERWPVGCQICDLLTCDGKKETAEKRIRASKKQTNADKIRSMTDEELAEFMYKSQACKLMRECNDDWTCDACWLDWLKQECAI